MQLLSNLLQKELTMANYHGTSGKDTLNQTALELPEWATIWGGDGDDAIMIGNGTAVGEAGNDTITGTTGNSGVAYWNSGTGVTVNLATGIATDSFGGIDRLVNIHAVWDSGFDDVLTGSNSSETFWLGKGSDTVTGGGGNDTVIFVDVKSGDASISYNVTSDTFKIIKHFSNGDNGTDVLAGISTIQFIGENSDNVVVTRESFVPTRGFLRALTPITSANMSYVAQMRAGDFNGDGKADLLVARVNSNAGLTPEPLQILTGDGAGHFTDGTLQLFKDGVPTLYNVGRIFAADFNNDGITDIFCPDFGVDAPPFPGGQNALFLSNKVTGKLENATASLPQALRENHGASVGDINHDGYLDVLVNALNEPTGNANQLLVNDKTGHFTPSQALLPASIHPVNYVGNTWSMLRDLNDDGFDDMVIGTWDPSPYASQVFLNNGKGNFSDSPAINLPRSGVDREIVVGIETIDLNGDALPDMVLSVTNGGLHSEFYRVPYLQLLVNDGNGKFHDETATRLPQSTATPAGNDPTARWYLSATAMDVNSDGYQDIVADAGYVNGMTSKVFLNDGKGTFSIGWESPLGTHVVAFDVNSDGKPDLVESSAAGYTVLTNAFPQAVGPSHIYHASDVGGKVLGNANAETMYSGKGNDDIDSAGGLDTVIFQGARSNYTLTKVGESFTVTDTKGLDGTDTLSHVERLKFADSSVALDVDGVGGQAYRIYQAAFNRSPDQAGLGYWISVMDKGVVLKDVALGFTKSAEFISMYGAAPSNADIVSKLYENVLHRAGEPAGVAYWLDVLDSKAATVAEVLANFSEGAENKAALIGVVENGMAYIPFSG